MKRIHNDIVVVNEEDLNDPNFDVNIAPYKFVFAENNAGQILPCKMRHMMGQGGIWALQKNGFFSRANDQS